MSGLSAPEGGNPVNPLGTARVMARRLPATGSANSYPRAVFLYSDRSDRSDRRSASGAL